MFGFGRQGGGLKRESSGRSQHSSSSHNEELALQKRQLSEARAALKEADAKILSLERSRDEDTQRIWKMKEQMSKVEAERDKERSLLRLDKRRLEAELGAERENSLKLERELRDKSSLSEYAKLVEEVIQCVPHHPQQNGESGEDSGSAGQRKAYQDAVVARLKHHLTRSLRRMEVMSNRTASVQSSCESLVKCLREEYARDLDVKSQDQVKIMNQLAVHRLEKEDLERQWKEEREKHERVVRELETRLEESERRRRQLEEALMKAGGQGGDREKVGSPANSGGNDAAPSHNDSPGNSKQTKHLDTPQSRPADSDLERQLHELRRVKDEMEETFRREASDRDRMIAWLEEENYGKDRLIRKLQQGESLDGSSGRLRHRGSGSAASLSSAGGIMNAGHGSSGSLRRSFTGGSASGSREDGQDRQDVGDEASQSSAHHASVSSASASASGMTHPPAAEWMNPLDASLMGMSFSVVPSSVPTLDEEAPLEEEEEENAKDHPTGTADAVKDGEGERQ